MLAFKYSEFAYLLQSDPLYMIAVGCAFAVVCYGITLALVSIFYHVARTHPIKGLVKIYRVWRAL